MIKHYLVFQLYAPMASWGEEAAGEIRHTAAIPTRSALLGLLAAAIGIARDEEERLNLFNQHYHLAVRPLSSCEAWLRDYQTVSVPRENKKYHYATRRDELLLAPEEVGTLVTQREYRCDGYWHVAISATPQPPVSLEALHAALLKPHYPLYLGRKSCPLALPLSPRLMHGTLNQIFHQAAHEMHVDELASLIRHQPHCYWDDPDEESLLLLEQQRSSHQPISRRRWQFSSTIRFSGLLQEMQ